MSSLRVRCWSWLLPLLGFCLLLQACAGSEAPAASEPGARGPEREARVLDERGQPVAGAEVAFLPASEALGLADVTRDCELSFAAAPRARSGADGIVRLPTALASVAAVARQGDRFGVGTIHFHDRSVAMHELRIAPDRHLVVHVRDAAGTPRPFVPVEVRVPASQWQQFRDWNVDNVGLTDADGRLTLWHAQRLYAWDLQRPMFELRARVVGAEPPFVAIDLATPRVDPLVLVCPPHGRIFVQRWLAPGIADGSDDDPCAWLIRDDYDGERPPQAFGDFPGAMTGPWRSWPLALGQRWRLRWGGVQREVVGPAQDGEAVRVEHTLLVPDANGEKRFGVVAALERPDGSPCAGVEIALGSPLQAQGRHVDRVRTDAVGRVQFVTRWASAEFTVVGENLYAERRLPAAPTGVVDLGVVRLAAPRTLAAGRCVDVVTGLPIRVCLQAPSATWAWRTGGDGAFALVDAPSAPWPSTGELSLRVGPDRDGQTCCFGYRQRLLPLAIGGSNLEVRLERARVLRSTLHVDAAIGGIALDVRVCTSVGSGWLSGTRHETAGRVQHAWEVSDDFAAPANMRLEVHSDDDESPLAVVDGTSFRPTPDGFDVELDLRGALEEYDVFTDGIEDMPFQGYWFVRSRGEQRWRRMTLQRHVSLVVRRGAEIEAVFAPSFQPWQRRTLTTTFTRWRPEPGSQLELTWDAPELPGVEVGVLVLLRQFSDRELAGVVDPRVDADDDPHLEREHAWPLAPDALTALHANPGWGKEVRSTAAQHMRVWQLGQYVVVPYAKTAKGLHWFVEQAVPFELVRAGSKVEVAVRVPAAAMQAAIEAK